MIPLHVFDMLGMTRPEAQDDDPRRHWVASEEPGVISARTLEEAVEELSAHGYWEQFFVKDDRMRNQAGHSMRADDLAIEALGRFEAGSAGDDQALVVALCERSTGRRGTYVVPFGSLMPRADRDMLDRIRACDQATRSDEPQG